MKKILITLIIALSVDSILSNLILKKNKILGKRSLGEKMVESTIKSISPRHTS